jgi:hypothetical protein
MKKKYLLWGLAALSFAACSGDDDINVTANDNANSNSEEIVGDRYMAVSLVSNNPTTRADEATYGSGNSSEYSVATYTESDVSADLITFYFFDIPRNQRWQKLHQRYQPEKHFHRNKCLGKHHLEHRQR